MPPTDVVKHDLATALTESAIDWTEAAEPMPMPLLPGPPPQIQPGVLVKPPTTTLVSNTEITTAPYRSVGKMRLRIGGGLKDASGWVGARRAFFTAGHCVYHPDFGGWITKAELCPRFAGETCEKSYKVITVYALKGWVDSNERRYDMAACVVTENFLDTEPPLAFHTGIIPAFKFTAIGYPIKLIAGYDFNVKRMWKSVGALVSFDDNRVWAENNLTNGASGGPWCDPDDKYIVSGLTSTRRDDPNVASSPAFIDGFQNLYDAVKGF